jgi:GGDEF domain-containing protein
MDIESDQAQVTLDRFREKVAAYKFPDITQVTVSIGYTLFDKRLTLNQLITQADIALYYCKTTTRNAVHGYQELVEKGLVAAQKDEKFPQTETP